MTPALQLSLALIGMLAVLGTLVVVIVRGYRDPDPGRVSGGWLTDQRRREQARERR